MKTLSFGTRHFFSLTTLLLLAACVSAPTGPSVLVLPGSGKSFDQFRADENLCEQYASGQGSNTTAADASANSGARSAALGTVVGAAAGLAIGGSRGAGAGAGAGLAMGAVQGASAGQSSADITQRRYDNAYIQCMYSYGHRVPVYGRLSEEKSHASTPPPPPPPPR
jgi:hypothetical protein